MNTGQTWRCKDVTDKFNCFFLLGTISVFPKSWSPDSPDPLYFLPMSQTKCGFSYRQEETWKVPCWIDAVPLSDSREVDQTSTEPQRRGRLRLKNPLMVNVSYKATWCHLWKMVWDQLVGSGVGVRHGILWWNLSQSLQPVLVNFGFSWKLYFTVGFYKPKHTLET